MRHRSIAMLAAILLAAILAACGGTSAENDSGAGGSAAPAADQAAVLITRDCGKDVLVEKTAVDAGQTAMQALQRVADVELDDGGKFVTTVEGVAQDTGKKLAWLFYVNGEAAQKGAAEVKLAAGDVEWWDLHDWENECMTVPPEAE